ncbi:hypothetical protein EFV37_14755 [Mesorhizobium loti]|uniref:hypothetical protein n=1 Tax=Mesorhizobium TaxID=68287 RepID=UPI000363F487|nr:MULTISPECIES: hypothetical protein [Mesorhizobium]ANN57864.1 hypothetical protein A9174_14590 [Mesorhizobium loti NZP2037]OBP84474.1 hypothetical protein BAE38_23685 [Mesorhizobium loti]OBP86237.1 hypothetical protein BAE41_26235 [Mesorhizobium loti]OBQ70810.1 hypothetical protein A9K72_32870 [Mesorhizobium loti]QKC63419.1 hypothetical protein EB229_14750 [Mesorhizobium jarvisii]
MYATAPLELQAKGRLRVRVAVQEFRGGAIRVDLKHQVGGSWYLVAREQALRGEIGLFRILASQIANGPDRVAAVKPRVAVGRAQQLVSGPAVARLGKQSQQPAIDDQVSIRSRAPQEADDRSPALWMIDEWTQVTLVRP